MNEKRYDMENWYLFDPEDRTVPYKYKDSITRSPFVSKRRWLYELEAEESRKYYSTKETYKNEL
jgi:hypothetical protein